VILQVIGFAPCVPSMHPWYFYFSVFQKVLRYFLVFSRQPVLRVVHICMTSTSGLGKTQAKYALVNFNFCDSQKYI
jgi:hypothetical protein